MKLFRMFGRNIRDAFKSVARNFSLSIASISCISITLIVVGLALILSFNVDNFAKTIKNDVTVVVFMSQDTTKEELESTKKTIEGFDNIESNNIKTKEESKNEMMNQSEFFKATMNTWPAEDNPLRDSYLIKVKEIENFKVQFKDLIDAEAVNLDDKD